LTPQFKIDARRRTPPAFAPNPIHIREASHNFARRFEVLTLFVVTSFAQRALISVARKWTKQTCCQLRSIIDDEDHEHAGTAWLRSHFR
jgi:hypothetical protein